MDKWVVEYSLSQKSYHYETVQECISRNITNIIDKNPTDYLVIGLVNNMDESCKYIEKFKSEHPDIPQFLMNELVNEN